MKVKSACPLCHGKGVIFDPDLCAPARVCGCSSGTRGETAVQGIPVRYREVSLESFWEWWKRRFPDGQVLIELNEANAQLESDVIRETIPTELQNKIAGILNKCAAKSDGEGGWKSLRPAQEPNGFGALKTWILKDHKTIDLCWIDGAPGSGRSSLASAALRAWCERLGKAGLFVSVRTLSQELKDTYYDTRSWQNTDFQSERDRMTPLQTAPCLVLDDFDRMDSDIRVVRAFVQLLDYRWSEHLPTIITAAKWAESLQTERETYSIMKLEDTSTLNRLSQARRVELVPTLSRLMKSV
ncbi:MAG: hypothetical protein LBB40_04305 [Holophagales bacterium]|jgi:hypothetical protein|nr:hypothetical protein [Holophagales bacterium]